MVIFVFILFISGCSELLRTYSWTSFKTTEKIKADNGPWEIQERIQTSTDSQWDIARIIIGTNWGGKSGEEKRLVNKAYHFNENILSLIYFPQKDGSYEPLLKKPYLTKKGRINYQNEVYVYQKKDELWVTVSPCCTNDKSTRPYTNCGFLTGNQKVAYLSHKDQEPEHYYGKFDLKDRKFYISRSNMPITYFYRAEWEGSPVTIIKDQELRKFSPGFYTVEEQKIKYKNYPAFISTEYKYRTMPLICKAEDFEQAKIDYQNYLEKIYQPDLDKYISYLSEHEKATLKREECDGPGLNEHYGCSQGKELDIWTYGDPKKLPPPRIVDTPDAN